MAAQRRTGSGRAARTHDPFLRLEVSDIALVNEFRRGNRAALDALMLRYHQFVRLKASSYFIAGGDAEDLIQEGLVGLYKAVRDYREDREASFRSFAELCITRQIITAIKTATRQKHQALNGYVSLSQSPGGDNSDDGDCCFADLLPGPAVQDPVNQVISSEELHSLKVCLIDQLSGLESNVLRFYMQGLSYERIACSIGCDCKTVDNALQRIKRKIDLHMESRRVVY
jgi:RNA polymerase sporulation-specific sigma factor